MKKIGRISALNRRVVRQNLATSTSILIAKERFSGVFSPEIEKYEVGDLVQIKYKKVGFLNKIETIRLIAKKQRRVRAFCKDYKFDLYAWLFLFLLYCVSFYLLWGYVGI